MQLTFLGTASCYPTANRAVSCTALRFDDGDVWLFDCGEGSQVQLQKSPIHPRKISKIFITHLHGDHLFGLPGLICTLGNQIPDRTDFILDIYGPVGLRRYLRESLCLSQSPLPYKYVVNELVPSESKYSTEFGGTQICEESTGSLHPQEILGRQISSSNEVWALYTDKKVSVSAALLKHRIISFGFVVKESSTPGQLNVKLLKEKGVPPGPLYGRIKAGEIIMLDNGDVITPSEVLGLPKAGRLVTILGDTCDSSKLNEIARGSDVLVHEATLEDSLMNKAIENGHSTPKMAAEFAVTIQAKSLILFHFSQRYKNEVCEIKKEESTVTNLLNEAEVALKNSGSDCEAHLAYDLMEYTIKRPENICDKMQGVKRRKT